MEAAQRWKVICELFHELSDLDPADRRERLIHIGDSDPQLKCEVEALLAGDDVADARLAHLKVGISDVLHRNLAPGRPAVDALRLVGQTLSHFRIIEPIAAGGMGVVYRALDTRLSRDVALKLPLAPQQLDSQGRARFLREAHAAGALDHPNLCSVYEVGESEDGQPFLAMTLYAGESLEARIARDAPLPLADALDIARQIASGLAFAHNAGVVHRDLKPGNIMLLPDGTAKILDFGLAKFTDVSNTASGVALGTVAYMAPEQIRGRSVDARADLWSVGVLLFEMLTGVRPFRGDDIGSTAHSILYDDAPRPSTLRAELTRSIDELVSALLQKQPAHRYATAHDLVLALDALMRGERPAFPRHISRWLQTRSHRLEAALVMLAAAIATIVGGGARVFPTLMQRKPTGNAEAYQLYLRARAYERTLADAVILDGPNAVADTLYRRALALDPDFAVARARLASLLIRTSRGDRAQLEHARQEATKALHARPGLAEAHVAIGLYWQQRNDHARALAEFERARKGLSKSSELHGAIGLSYSALGRWQEAAEELEQALRLDPTNITYAPGLSATYGRQRRYRDSQRNWDRYIARNPDAYWAMLIKGLSVTRSDGIADTLAAALHRIPPEWDHNGLATLSRFYVARLQRHPADALAALAAAKTTRYEDDVLFIPHTLMWAMAYEDAGDSARSRMYYDSARVTLQDKAVASPRDPRLQIALGRALAGSGKRKEAIRAAQRAIALAPVSSDLRGTAFMGGAAEIFAYLGENDAALRLLEQLLQLPAGREASVPLLRADPAFDRLRSDPRFDRLLARFAAT